MVPEGETDKNGMDDDNVNDALSGDTEEKKENDNGNVVESLGEDVVRELSIGRRRRRRCGRYHRRRQRERK